MKDFIDFVIYEREKCGKVSRALGTILYQKSRLHIQSEWSIIDIDETWVRCEFGIDS